MEPRVLPIGVTDGCTLPLFAGFEDEDEEDDDNEDEDDDDDDDDDDSVDESVCL
jgi:hypothetical protein